MLVISPHILSLMLVGIADQLDLICVQVLNLEGKERDSELLIQDSIRMLEVCGAPFSYKNSPSSGICSFEFPCCSSGLFTYVGRRGRGVICMH